MPVPGEIFFVKNLSNVDKTYKQLNDEFIRKNSGGYKDIVTAISLGGAGIVVTIIGVFFAAAIYAVAGIAITLLGVADGVKKALDNAKYTSNMSKLKSGTYKYLRIKTAVYKTFTGSASGNAWSYTTKQTAQFI
ncbi:hypothetical protein AN960_09110 [Bacillus sp. FJAT-25509]|uniref:hypothetical protein n=1 Tax=Bacillaceae TaxID=186817 RepID=UPI00070236B6|nr:hypothetical protein [Bacillus sp. FJAT-25509]KQL40104.1 hypothetical protein AN960_09110 [Bacillus sp. FJAT-25509]